MSAPACSTLLPLAVGCEKRSEVEEVTDEESRESEEGGVMFFNPPNPLCRALCEVSFSAEVEVREVAMKGEGVRE